jgi:hypothetical protein
VTPSVLIVVGGALLVVAQRSARKNRLTTWIAVPGTITESEIHFDGEQYLPCIRYEYSVKSRKYTANTVKPAMLTYNWAAPAKRVCDKYPVGSQVRVYIDEMKPEVAALEPRIDRGGVLLAYAISALLILCGLALLLA